MWIPTIASPLEGRRGPTVEWHYDVQVRHTNLLCKYGRTYEEIFNATPGRTFAQNYYQIKDGTFPVAESTRNIRAAG